MGPLFLTFAVILVLAQLVLPRRLGFLPILVATCHLGNGDVVGPLTAVRLIIILGLIRAAAGGYLKFSMAHPLDRAIAILCGIAMFSSFFHPDAASNPFVERLGLCLNIAGSYIYGRSYLPDVPSLERLGAALPYVLVPLAILLLAEQATQRNYYHALGARSEGVAEREGRFRAKGPFNHPILAGTAGASSLPLMVMIWRRRKTLAVVGLASGVAITAASASSGPISTAILGMGALFLWRFRPRMRQVRWIVGGALVVMSIVMSRPIWFLMARVDLVGGSTGWHRAKLFDNAIKYLDEWWLAGTDYTRHWMHSGVSWSENHTDITNYYIHLGVLGGAGLSLLLVYFIWKSCFLLGARMKELRSSGDPSEFSLWCAGACLFTHAITFFSISYFGQMYALFWIVVGAVPGVAALVRVPSETPARGRVLEIPGTGVPGRAG